MQQARFKQKFWLGLGLVTASLAHPLWVGGGVGMVAIAPLLIPSVAEAATLTNWQFDPNTSQLEVTVPEGTTPRYFLLAQPARIVMDLPNTQLGAVPEQQTYAGLVRQIRVAQFQPDLARIVIELAPDVVLAAEQVELHQVGGENVQGGDRWILRPLIASAATADSPSVMPLPAAGSGSHNLPTLEAAPVIPPPPAPTPVRPAPEAARQPDNSLPAETATNSTPASPSPEAASPADLPPLEPGATEIPIVPPISARLTEPEQPSEHPEPESPSTEPNTAAAEIPDSATAESDPEPIPEEPPAADGTGDSSPGATTTPANESSPTEVPTELPPSDMAAPAPASPPAPSSVTSPGNAPTATARTSPLELLDALPPARSSVNQPPTVSVPPPSNTPTPSPNPASPPPASPPPTPPAEPEGTSTAASTVPALGLAAPPVRGSVAPSPPTVIEFGQPLSATPSAPDTASDPDADPAADTRVAVAPASGILIPSGTVLSLRYPGETPLELRSGTPRQEVLLLEQEVRDRSGNVIAPAGSQILGQFETDRNGSRFVATAMTLQGRNVQLKGESERLEGDRDVSDDALIRNSAIGAAALSILDGFSGIGLIGGIAAGAATTFLTAPQPAVIQPNQIVEVRLTENVLAEF